MESEVRCFDLYGINQANVEIKLSDGSIWRGLIDLIIEETESENVRKE